MIRRRARSDNPARVPLTGPAAAGEGGPGAVGALAPPIGGFTPEGRPVRIDPEGDSFTVYFLTSSCRTCTPVWEALGPPPQAGRTSAQRDPEGRGRAVVVVTPSASTESRRRVADLAARCDDVTVVMSTETWFAYGPGPSPWMVRVQAGAVRHSGPAVIPEVRRP